MSKVIPFREFPIRPDAEIDFLHSPFFPSELYEGDKVSAILSFKDKLTNVITEMRVWRISPLGIELLIEDSHQELGMKVEVGKKVDLKVYIGKHISEFTGLVVASKHRDRGRELIGVRWSPSSGESEDIGSRSDDRRKSERWLCGLEFLPTGIAPNPVRFNDFIHFKIRDLSVDGMQIYTSLRNKQLIPGMILDSIVSLPMTGEVKFKLKIINTRILCLNGRDFLSIGVTIHNLDARINEIIGQYIFQFGPSTSIQELREKGFRIKSPSSAIEFGYVRTADEYKEVLALRQLTYSRVGKIAKDTPDEGTSDIYDTRARILTARHHGHLVASARLMFHNPEDQMEHEQFIELPDSIPGKSEIAELTRICTHPEYRGSDLFFGIIRHITMTCAQSNRSWILGSAEPKLISAYTRLGYDRTGIVFQHSALGSAPHEILIGNLAKMLSGRGVEMSLWNELYLDISSYLKEHELLDFDPYMNFRMRVYSTLAPVTALLTRKIRSPRKSKTYKGTS